MVRRSHRSSDSPKWHVPFPEGDVRTVPSISTLVLNTLTLGLPQVDCVRASRARGTGSRRERLSATWHSNKVLLLLNPWVPMRFRTSITWKFCPNTPYNGIRIRTVFCQNYTTLCFQSEDYKAFYQEHWSPQLLLVSISSKINYFGLTALEKSDN